MRQGTLAGVFEKAEQEMIDRVFRLGSLRLPAIMTPRRDIVVLYTTDTPEAIAGTVKAAGHSRYPLCDASLENVLGIVSTRDLLLDCLGGSRFDLRSCAREVPNIPESASALKALEHMKKSGSQVALVIDEFGGLQGIVSMADFAGAIVGLLSDEEKPMIVQRKDGSLLVDGLLPIEDLGEAVRLPELSTGESHGYSTVGGFALARIGRIPSAGDTFEIGE